MNNSPENMIYLDNAASMPVDKKTLSFYIQQFSAKFANQEAGHSFAYNTALEINAAENKISELFTQSPDNKVCFSGSGTDALNIALSFFKGKKGKIFCSESEHPAVHAALSRLENCEVCEISLKKDGSVNLKELSEKINKECIGLVTHHVNGESGKIQDIISIGKILKKKSPKAFFLCDTIQSACKIPIPWKEASPDIIFVSSHKIGAPEGAVTIVRKNPHLNDFFRKVRNPDYRIGRCTPASLLCLANQIEKQMKSLNKNYKSISKAAALLRKNLRKKFGNRIIFPVEFEKSSPYIQCFLLPGFDGGIIVRMLSEENIMIGAGSACSSETQKANRTITAMGYDRKSAFAALRVSFGFDFENEKIDRLAEKLHSVLEKF